MNKIYIQIRKYIASLSLKKLKTKLISEITAGNQSNNKISLSLALGVFVAFSPFWGFQTILAIGLALILKLNKVLALITVNISSIPPLIPLIIYLNFQCGNILFTGKIATTTPDILDISSLGDNLLTFIIGSLVCSLLMGIITYYLTLIILTMRREKLKY